MRYLFDLTTTAQWRGQAVGIVRVEQELARRARRYLGDDVAFCLYDRSRAAVLVIDDTVADDLLAGRIRVDFAIPPPAPQGYIHKARQRLRAALLRNATAYHIFQGLRGRSFTRDQILQFQAAARTEPLSPLSTVASRRVDGANVPLAKLPHYPARLDTNTTIISGGLDWQYKDLRAFWALKQTYRFSYCAIIYDLIAVRFPQFVGPAYTTLLRDYFGELLWLADRAMCISQSTRQDWLRHADEVGVESVPSAVFPLGCDVPSDPSQTSSKIELSPQLRGKRFALFVSTIEPRKNHRMLYQAWDECIRAKQIDPTRDRLVFVGRRGWAVEDLLREIATNPSTRDTIVLLHEVSDQQLAMLYRSCAFALFPSMYEGFGLPLVEALGYGKLCVSSTAGALSEIGGDLVMRLDPRDTLGWTHVIGRLMSCSGECEAWEQRIKQHYQPTTWDTAANSFFNTIVGLESSRTPDFSPDPEMSSLGRIGDDCLSGA